LKRDVLFEAMKNTTRVKEQLLSLWAFYNTEKVNVGMGLLPRTAMSVEVMRSWWEAINRLDGSVMAVYLVCDEDMSRSLREFNLNTRQVAGKMITGEPEAYSAEDLAHWWEAVSRAMRKEIGNEKADSGFLAVS